MALVARTPLMTRAEHPSLLLNIVSSFLAPFDVRVFILRETRRAAISVELAEQPRRICRRWRGRPGNASSAAGDDMSWRRCSAVQSRLPSSIVRDPTLRY